jgi:hypothetical protein
MTATITQMPDRPTSITAAEIRAELKASTAQIRAELQASTGVPVIALMLLVARMQHQHVDAGGCGVLLQEWAKVATEILAQLAQRGNLPAIQYARKTAQRAIRIQQGYESSAKDKAYQILLEYMEGAHGVDRPMTDEECVALNNGLIHAFAGYGAFLDHVAGATARGVI